MFSEIRPFEYNPFPMLFKHFGIDPSKFPKETYMGGTSLLSIIKMNFSVRKVCLYTKATTEEESKMLEDIGIISNSGIRIGKLNIVRMESIEEEINGPVRCYANIHEQKFMMEVCEISRAKVTKFNDFEFADFLKQMILIKEIKIDGKIVSISQLMKNISENIIIIDDTAYDIMYVMNTPSLFNELVSKIHKQFC